MNSDSPSDLVAGPPGKEMRLVCPLTGHRLCLLKGEVVTLDSAGVVLHHWHRDNGFLDLVVGTRFLDTTEEAGRLYEIESNTYSTEHYWIPLFRKMFPDYKLKTRSILAVGCGIGVEVDLLCEAGFACFGVDNGNRTVDWPHRRHPEGLLLANGMNLPFANGAFDAVFCGCVFPHVGVVGDSRDVTEHFWDDRQRLASEMVRVTRRGGHVIACSPNRRFPFDIFHWRKPGCYRVTCNPPWSRFLLSVSDFRRLFRNAGASEVRALPVAGFWGFVTMRKSWKGQLLSLPLRFMFHLASQPAGVFLRSTPLLPWITVGCRV
jgi:SAM-dependent methyltransferase